MAGHSGGYTGCSLDKLQPEDKMRFEITVYGADNAKTVESLATAGPEVDFDKLDELENMGTCYVPAKTQQEAEWCAHHSLDGGTYPVFRTKQIASFLAIEDFELDANRCMRVVYDLEIERPVVVDVLVAGAWVAASPADVEAVREDDEFRTIVWDPEDYPDAKEVMSREGLPEWAKARLPAYAWPQLPAEMR
jgi:hypothetical protein